MTGFSMNRESTGDRLSRVTEGACTWMPIVQILVLDERPGLPVSSQCGRSLILEVHVEGQPAVPTCDSQSDQSSRLLLGCHRALLSQTKPAPKPTSRNVFPLRRSSRLWW